MKNLIFIFLVIYNGFTQEYKQINVYFDLNKYELNDKARQDLISYTKEIDTTKNTIKIQKILGYTDGIGTDEYNNLLSIKRADEATRYLKQHGAVVDDSVIAKGMGRAINKDNDQENRRVTLIYTIIPKPIKVTTSNKKDLKIDLATHLQSSQVGDVILLEGINFHEGTSILTSTAEMKIKTVLKSLKQNPTIKVIIQGHICCIKTLPKEPLSKSRAQTVYTYLTKNGIAKSRLSFEGYGSTQPKYPLPEVNEDQRNANRRVEFKVIAK